MQREIEALLRAWQRGRADEERVVADIMSALADLAASRQKFLSDLQDAAMAMTGTNTRHPGTPPPLPDIVTDAIMRARQDMPGRYNN